MTFPRSRVFRWPCTLSPHRFYICSSAIQDRRGSGLLLRGFSTGAMDIEAAKKAAAQYAVSDHFNANAEYVGIGSGTTIVYAVEAIMNSNIDTSNMKFVPTGYQSRQVILQHGLTPIAFDSLPPNRLMDVCFDGADEIDEELNCIKGGGACLYQEKLVATHSKKFICVADYRKLQTRLLSNWPSIPIEVEPLAASAVISALTMLGSTKPLVRTGTLLKAGPLKTDQDNFIVDAPFPTLILKQDEHKQNSSHQSGEGPIGTDATKAWEVEALAKEIKLIEGVLSVGIFSGENGLEALAKGSKMGGQKPAAAYFGMSDGSVLIRRRGESDRVLDQN